MESNLTSPVLAEAAPVNNNLLGIHSALLPYSQNSSVFSSALFLTIPWKMPVILDDVRSSLLDSMISSSPTHEKLMKELNAEASSNDSDQAYQSWMIKYPSALTSFEQITDNANGKRVALFLDYDGTLSPIVDNPDHAFMSNAMRAAVKHVAGHFPTAIVSGRSRDKVYEFVGLAELYYAGSHGMDIVGPVRPMTSKKLNCISSTDEQGKEVNLFQPASEFLPLIDEVYNSLVEKTKCIAGANVENNKFCVSVHYRNVEEKNWEAVGKIVEETLLQHPRLRLTHGRKVMAYCKKIPFRRHLLSHFAPLFSHPSLKVLEVRPVLKWDKGKAVEFLLESLRLTSYDDVLPIYVGDDRTDEDAFKVLRDGNRGFGVLVSSSPKETNASYSLRDPSQVMEFLKGLVLWKKKMKKISTS